MRLETDTGQTVYTQHEPETGHTVARQQEEEMAVEKQLSVLQLKDTVDRSLVLAEQVHDFRHKPETQIVEQLQRLITTQGTEIQQLRKLAADLNQRLTSGFYPTPYVGQGGPPTPGMAAGSEVQQPEVWLYNQHGNGNAYSVYPNGLSFYSSPRYAQCVYHNGVQYTPFPEAQHFSRLDNAYGTYLYGVPHSSQEVEIRQVAKVPLGQQQANNFCQQPETEMRQTPERPVVQFCTGAMPGDSRMLQNFTRMETSAPHAESEPVDTVYHIARDDSSFD